jgi:hypothetical protein
MWSYKQGVRFVLPVLTGLLLSVPAFADSQVRMVRLSDVEGAVQIDRNTGQGFERASVNLPITQGVTLRTRHDGFAIVQFEDGSTLRLTPGTVAGFTELKLRDSGAKASVANVQQGMAYVSYVGTKNDEFALTFGGQTLKLDKAAHLRLDVGRSEAALAVFKGDAQVEGPSGVADVSKKQTATFYLTANGPYSLAKNVADNPYDDWDKQQEEYDQRYAKSNSYTSSPYTYGVNDLNYYGNFFNAAGYGMMWQPFFAGAGWDPFMDGMWAFYPGMGYGWASAYPWGWLPYHYGSWMFLPSYGWAWQPGGSWMGLTNAPNVVNPPRGFQPPLVPSTPSRSLIAVGRGSTPFAGGGSANQLLIRNNSAGLGIPRGSIRNLSGMSQQAGQRGFVAARIQPQAANPIMYRTMSNGSAYSSSHPVASSRSVSPSYSAPSSSPSMAPMSSPSAGGGHSSGGHK